MKVFNSGGPCSLPSKLQVSLGQMTFPTMGKFPYKQVLWWPTGAKGPQSRAQWTTRKLGQVPISTVVNISLQHPCYSSLHIIQRCPWMLTEMFGHFNKSECFHLGTGKVKCADWKHQNKHFLVSGNTSVYAINSQCHEGLSTWMEDAVSSPAPLVLSWMVFIGWIALLPNILAPQRASHLSLRGRLQFSWP